MKKNIILIFIIMVISIVLGGCGEIITGEEDSGEKDTDKGSYTFEAVILETSDSFLVAPEEESDAYRSSDKISFGLTDVTIRNSDGDIITKEELTVGDRIEVTYDGIIMESYPAQINASEVRVIEANIKLSGLLALIDDLYQEDSGLNYNIEMIAMDTSGWKDITEEEKAYIFEHMKQSYSLDIVEGTFEELAEQGLIDKDNLLFDKGILIKIANIEFKNDNKKITCSIEKWRSGLGAIGSDDVTASFKDGTWTITKEGMWIS